MEEDFSHEKQANGKEYILNEQLADELLKDNPESGYGFPYRKTIRI